MSSPLNIYADELRALTVKLANKSGKPAEWSLSGLSNYKAQICEGGRFLDARQTGLGQFLPINFRLKIIPAQFALQIERLNYKQPVLSGLSSHHQLNRYKGSSLSSQILSC